MSFSCAKSFPKAAANHFIIVKCNVELTVGKLAELTLVQQEYV